MAAVVVTDVGGLRPGVGMGTGIAGSEHWNCLQAFKRVLFFLSFILLFLSFVFFLFYLLVLVVIGVLFSVLVFSCS